VDPSTLMEVICYCLNNINKNGCCKANKNESDQCRNDAPGNSLNN